MKNEIISNWLDKIKSHQKKYSGILNSKDHGYVYSSEYGVEEISNLCILAWQNGKLFYQYYWNADGIEDTRQNIVIGFKNYKKVLFIPGKEQVYTIGIEKEDNVKQAFTLFVAFKTSDGGGELIFADYRNKEFKDINFWYGNEYDAITGIIESISTTVDWTKCIIPLETEKTAESEASLHE